MDSLQSEFEQLSSVKSCVKSEITFLPIGGKRKSSRGKENYNAS